MAPSDKVSRSEGAIFIEFYGRDNRAALELSRLVKYFLEGSMYRVEYLDKFETKTLKVYDKD